MVHKECEVVGKKFSSSTLSLKTMVISWKLVSCGEERAESKVGLSFYRCIYVPAITYVHEYMIFCTSNQDNVPYQLLLLPRKMF